MSAATGLAKTILIIYNVIFALIGLAVMGFGIHMLINGSSGVVAEILDTPHSEGTNATFRNASYAVIVIGSITFLLALLGCCGAALNNRCLYIMYASVLILLLVVEVVLVFVLYFYGGKVQTAGKDAFVKAIDNYYASSADKKEAIDAFQQKMQSRHERMAIRGDPKDEHSQCTNKATDKDTLEGVRFTKGCIPAFLEALTKFKPVMYGVGGALIGIELIGIFLACCLCCAKGGESHYV